MVHNITLIVSGLVLLAGMFHVIPGLGKYLDRAGRFLTPFQGIIGIIAIVVGVLSLLSIGGIVLILAGLLLAAGLLGSLPNFGPTFKNIARSLGAFQVVIGVVAMVLGLLGLLGQVGRLD